MGIFSTLSKFFIDGGFWMLPIAVTQVVALAIIIERLMALYLARSTNQRDLVQRFEADIKRGDLDRVLMTAQSMGSHPIGLVVQAGAQAALAMGGREEIQAKMDEVLLHENAKFEKRTHFLAMLGNVGTLLGLLGTIIGMTKAFDSVASASAAEKGAVLASGISEAMNTTAYGLIAAIPALVMFAILLNRSGQLSDDLNQAALKAFNWLSYSFESVPTRQVRQK